MIRVLPRDAWLLFGTRFVRLFAYGFLSVVLILYLSTVGLSDDRIGLLLMLTLLGDVAVSLWVTTRADRIGRRRMLAVGAMLMLGAAAVFAGTANFWLLLLAATIGVISPSGNEVGPFLPIEQAALAQLCRPKSARTSWPGITSLARSRRHSARWRAAGSPNTCKARDGKAQRATGRCLSATEPRGSF